MTLKDSLDTEGVVTTGGTKGRANFIPQEDATLVARLRSAGAILLGKSNTPELTLAGETNNLVYGQTNNPFDLSRTTGGSSGGAGAIIAAGGSPFDIGSDTGGSIRYPAHFCGIAGIKPNSGRVPRTGHIVSYGLGATDSLTQNGPMARFVEDLALILPIISGPDWRDPFIVPVPLGNPADVETRGLRVCVYTDNGIATPTPETIAAVSAAAKSLADTGASVEEDVPAVIAENPDISNELSGSDGRAWTLRLLAKSGTTETHPWLSRRLDEAEAIPVGEFTALLERVDEFRSAMLSFMQSYDVIVCPVAAFPALPHGESFKDENRKRMSYTSTYNITGWPGAVIRGGTSPEGLPIGVQVVAQPWREDVALAVAQHLETALGGWQKPPL
jgi:amidase